MKPLQILDSKDKNARWISQVLQNNNMTDLPDNVILNKVLTGAGMTSEALTNPQPYVIAVPLKRLIQNKAAWCSERNIDMLGVYAFKESGVDYEDILNFKGDKIMVTYDSLSKVTKALTENGRINDFKIMIDECHHIIRSGGFRYGAINRLLKEYTLYKSFIFGTATPIDDRYQHPALKDVPRMKIKWYDLEPVTVNYCVYYEDLLKAVAVTALKHLSGEIKANAHFFINSVDNIMSVVRFMQKGGFKDISKIRIITAGSELNEYKMVESLGKGYSIADVNSKSATINFYTSTCFDGIDISDENGLTYIVSDGKKDHSKIDIVVQLPQIIGRLRNTKYKNFVNLMYSPNRYYSHTSEEEFEEYTKKRLEEAKRYIDRYNSETEEMIKEALFKAAKDNIYILVNDNDELELNDTAMYSEMQNYHTIHKTYYVTKKDGKNKDFVEVINDTEYGFMPYDNVQIEGLNKVRIGKKANFTDICKSYNDSNEEQRSVIAKLLPIIKEAYDVLGYDKVKALEFRQNEIKEALVLNSDKESKKWKVANLLNLRNGEWISQKEVKDKLQEIYKALDINAVAKSTDIKGVYDVTESSKRVEGVKVKGYVVIAPLVRKK